MSLFSAIFHISKYEQENRAKLAWPPVHVRNDVASVLDRTDQLDLVTFPLHNPAQLGCGLVALNLTLNAMIRATHPLTGINSPKQNRLRPESRCVNVQVGGGLALGLCECYRETMLSPQEDAYGRYIYRHFRGHRSAEVMERDDGFIWSNIELPGAYFAKFRDWPAHQRQAMRFVRGRVLDIGCGAGRVALHLQSRSHDVLSVDLSPLAIKVCRLRGVKNTKVLSITQLTSRLGEFDTLIMFGTNFGLFANPRRARWLLKRFHSMTSPQARILAESLHPYDRVPPEHRKYLRFNRQRGRMPGQLRLRVRFGPVCTPWFDYLIVSPREMRSVVRGTGWHVVHLLDSRDPHGTVYVAVLEKVVSAKRQTSKRGAGKKTPRV